MNENVSLSTEKIQIIMRRVSVIVGYSCNLSGIVLISYQPNVICQTLTQQVDSIQKNVWSLESFDLFTNNLFLMILTQITIRTSRRYESTD
jgi:hypothetical protein